MMRESISVMSAPDSGNPARDVGFMVMTAGLLARVIAFHLPSRALAGCTVA